VESNDNRVIPRLLWRLRWSTRATRVLAGPLFDLLFSPDASDRQVCFRLWEVLIGIDQLVDSLPRDSQKFGNFCHADEIEGHLKKRKKTLAQMQ
jgi:hypothetical protein